MNMVTIGDITTYFQNVNNQISLALDCVGIPIIVFIEAVTSEKYLLSFQISGDGILWLKIPALI